MTDAGAEPVGRMARLLARRLEEAGREADDAFSVAELRRSLLPYPLCRETMDLASKAEYDVALLRLLGDDEELGTDEQKLEEDVERELDTPEPGLGVLDDHAAATVRPGPGLRRRLRDRATEGTGGAAGDVARQRSSETAGDGRDEEGDEGKGDAAGDRPAAGTDGGVGDSGEAPGGSASPGDEPHSAGVSGVGERRVPPVCPACGQDVPEIEGVRYCPSCGSPVVASPCRRCGEELRAGWRHCPFCGSERHGHDG